MNEKFEKIINQLLIFFIIEALIILFGYQYFSEFIFFIQLILIFINGSLLVFILFIVAKQLKQRQFNIQQVLGKESKEALIFGEIGMVTMDEQYSVTWVSELFDQSAQNFIGERVTTWIPEVSDILRGNAHEILATINNRTYQITRLHEGKTLFFKDITDLYNLRKTYQDTRLVLGLLVLDNFDIEMQNRDDDKKIELEIKMTEVIRKWSNDYRILIKKLSANRYFVILNEQTLVKLQEAKFDLLLQIKQKAFELKYGITLSMAFAKGSSDVKRLEEMLNQTIELVQNRGGDQAAINSEDDDIQFFGASSQSTEREPKVKARFMAITLQNAILNAANVIVAGHKNMDFDCMAGALSVASIAKALGRPVYIITKTGGIESKLNAMLELHEAELSEAYQFVSIEEATSKLKPSSLLVLVDHHTAHQSNGAQLLTKVHKIGVFDHHRRMKDLDFNPYFIYQDTSASSTIEILAELFEHFKNPIELTELVATIMMTGLIIDTNHFRVRSGMRTFEVAALLKDLGANLSMSELFLKDEIDEFELKSDVKSSIEKIGQVALFLYTKKPITRTLMSQVADDALKIRGIEASFVIAMVSERQAAISARSLEKINVQTIMEKMGGGGHFNAAAFQSDQATPQQLYEQLVLLVKQQIEGEL